MFSFPFVSYSLPHRALQNVLFNFPHIQFSSVTQSGPTLCYPMNCSPLVLPVHHQLWSSLKLTSIELVMPSSHLISVIPCCSFPQSLPVNQLQWDGQSTGVSGLASFLRKNTQGWSLLEWTSWVFLKSMGLSRVFSITTVQKRQFFHGQFFSQHNNHIHTWLLEKPWPWLDGPLLAK